MKTSQSTWGYRSEDQLPHLIPDRRPRRRAAGLETALAALRTEAYLPHLAGAKLRVQYRLRQEPGLCVYGGVQSACRVLHLPYYGNWECCRRGDVFQARES